MLAVGYWVLWMPGPSSPPATGKTVPDPVTDELADTLRRDVVALAHTIGPRHHGLDDTLARTADHLEQQFIAAGLAPQRHSYRALNTEFVNLVVELRGTHKPDEIIVVGAHYDTVANCPGANDNGSGVAALLALARLSRNIQFARTIRFVAFANEEHPYADTDAQGSKRYAEELRTRGEKIVGMLALETIGYYSDQPGSQRYPAPLSWFYPRTGNFVAFVGDMGSRAWVTRAIAAFRRHAKIPSQGVAAPRLIADISRSDHNAFWQQDYPAFMLTDTAPFRYPYYHDPGDTPEHLDYGRLAKVVLGVHDMLTELANE